MAGMSTGFVQLRRGLFQHVKDGRLSFFEASLYVAMLSDANPSTGVCYGSAGLFSALYGISSRTCRDALEKLETKGYLKRFPVRGKHGSYPILINKFRCSVGAMTGKYVNSNKSQSYKDIIYELCDEGVDDNVNESAVASVNESAVRVDTGDKKLEKKTGSPNSKPSPVQTPLLSESEIYPEWLPVDTWNAFLEMRKKIKKPMTETAKKYAIRDLEKLRKEHNSPRLVLERSIMNSWAGVFPLPDELKTKPVVQFVELTPEQWWGKDKP